MITDKILVYIILVLLVIISLLGIAYKYESTKVDSLMVKNAAYKAAEGTYKINIERANSSIRDYQEQAKKREADSAAALLAIKPQVTKRESLAVKVMTYKPTTTDSAKASNDLFNQYIKERNN